MLALQRRGDGRVQMAQGAMAGQARMPRLPRPQPLVLQHLGDGLHHQLMLMAILGRAQQGFRWLLLGGGAGEGITAQLPLAHRQQALR